MEYNKNFAKMARAILSKPFKSKQHVCQILGITQATYDNWLTEIEPFEKAVSEGFLIGEVKARDFMARAALLPSNKINLDVFAKLAKDIYGIGNAEEVSDNAEVVRWKVEIVRPEPKTS